MSAQGEQAVTFTALKKAELLPLPPDPKPLEANEVTGRTLVSLVSPGTELNSQYLGEKFPAQPGYAAVFQVDATGPAVTDLKPGSVVFCTGPAGVGGHRSRQRCPREAALPVPGNLAPEVAVHARLMGVSMTTLVTTGARPPDKVLVLGLGPVGNLAAQLFKACGYQVTGVEPVEARRRLAQEKGIAPVLDKAPEDRKQSPDGFALALECCGHEQAVLDACRALRKKGELVLIGVPWARRTELHAFDITHAIFRRYLVVRSGWEWELPRYAPLDFRDGCIFANFAAAMRWLAEARVRVERLYYKAHPRDCQQVYQELLSGRSPALSVVFDWTAL